ncbi:preprotein translocase subunit SecG [Bacilli bacterium PM5-3]|nr:preprotein translocase subunit SecG [Bacilli bacterium PM5-3]MDH6603169.1 preprotein translocase subunit SecG [Bacilli bacterium PM5-9]
MVSFLSALLIVNAVILIIVVIMQPPKSENAAGTMSGTGVNVFAQTKERGAELVFKRATIVFGATFMIIPIIIALLK